MLAQEGCDRLDVVEELVHVDFFDHEAARGRPGGALELPEPLPRRLDAFSGSRFAPPDIIAESDRVAVPWTAERRRFEARAIHIWRPADGLIVEHWACVDDRGAVR